MSDQSRETKVCGSVLEYLDQAQSMTCSYCGKVEVGHIRCPNGHYICEVCHNRDAMQIIEDIAFQPVNNLRFYGQASSRLPGEELSLFPGK